MKTDKHTKENPKPIKAVVEIEPNVKPFAERMAAYLKKGGKRK